MNEELQKIQEQLEALTALAQRSSTGEDPEDVWSDISAFEQSSKQELEQARSRRAEAESAREKADVEALEVIQAQFEHARKQAEEERTQAESERKSATKARTDAETALAEAESIRNDAEEQRSQIISQAKADAQSIRDEARRKSDEELNRVRGQVRKEVQAARRCVEYIRTAIAEELEAQKILGTVSKLRSIPSRPGAAVKPEDAEKGRSGASIVSIEQLVNEVLAGMSGSKPQGAGARNGAHKKASQPQPAKK